MRISSQSHGIGHLMQIRMSNGLETSRKKSLGKPGFTHFFFFFVFEDSILVSANIVIYGARMV